MPENEWHRSSLRAFQAWPLLTFAAKHHQLLTYEELGLHLGLPRVAVGPNALHRVALYCEAKRLPLLNSIVVGKGSGKPEYDLEDKDWAQEQARVFAHTWINEENNAAPVPSIEDFEKATTTKQAAA
jgi:hypothetical protein